MRASPRLLVVFGAFWASLAAAQADRDEPKVDPKFESHAEKARREGEKVFKWIRLHSDAPRRPAPPVATEAPAAAGAAPKATAPAPRAAALVTAPPSPARTAAPPPVPPRSTPTPLPAVGPARASAPEPATLAVPAHAPASSPTVPVGAASTPLVDAATASPDVSEPAAAASQPMRAGAAQPGLPEPEDETALVLLSSVEPEFPAVLTRRLRKGWVHVRLSVNPDGSVGEVEVAGSSHPRLNEPALAAVRRWAFKPPGQAREATAELEFDLDGR